MCEIVRIILLRFFIFLVIFMCASSAKVNSDKSNTKPTLSDKVEDPIEGEDNNTYKENEGTEEGLRITQVVNALFVGLVIAVVILKYTSSKFSQDTNKKDSDSTENEVDDHDYRKLKDQYWRLRLQYFPAYFAAIFGDWLQGPYVYKLYSEYGFQENHISILFLTGFGSSFTFGTFTGPLADKFGRKSMTQVFCVLYSLSCVIKFSSNFWILICGRVCAGIATSLLFR
jgi:preprotein translocase subunit SecG